MFVIYVVGTTYVHGLVTSVTIKTNRWGTMFLFIYMTFIVKSDFVLVCYKRITHA